MSKYKCFSSFISATCRNYSSFPRNKLLCNNRRLTSTTQHDKKEDKETHFGFQKVKESEKSSKVHKVFEDVAAKYDIMNDAMSLGIHRLWKDIFMCRLAPTPGTKLLDVAGGTGDIAFRFLQYLSSLEETRPVTSGSGSHVTVCDINAHMLEVGKGRASSLGLNPASLTWLEGDAERLQLKSETFDAYTIAFGMRNVTRIDEALREAWRVLRPGGRFMCLEFSRVHNPTLQRLYDQYSFQVIPVLGQILAGQWKPYQYLVESIRQFPDQETYKGMIEEAGFQQVTYENLTFGIVAIHSGFKL